MTARRVCIYVDGETMFKVRPELAPRLIDNVCQRFVGAEIRIAQFGLIEGGK